jgi:hypothetical protein
MFAESMNKRRYSLLGLLLLVIALGGKVVTLLPIRTCLQGPASGALVKGLLLRALDGGSGRGGAPDGDQLPAAALTVAWRHLLANLPRWIPAGDTPSRCTGDGSDLFRRVVPAVEMLAGAK